MGGSAGSLVAGLTGIPLEGCCCGDEYIRASEESVDESVRKGGAFRSFFGTIHYPTGVAVEKLRSCYRGRMRSLPTNVAEILIHHGAQRTYAEFAEALEENVPSILSEVTGRNSMDIEATSRVVARFIGPFQECHVSVHLCCESEIISTLVSTDRGTQYQQGKKFGLWLVYVDRELQPAYFVQDERGVAQDSGPGRSTIPALIHPRGVLPGKMQGDSPERRCNDSANSPSVGFVSVRVPSGTAGWAENEVRLHNLRRGAYPMQDPAGAGEGVGQPNYGQYAPGVAFTNARRAAPKGYTAVRTTSAPRNEEDSESSDQRSQ